MSEDFNRKYPRLASEAYRITSPRDGAYNCVGWAVDKNAPRIWWPDTLRQLWPDFLACSEDLDTFIAFFQWRGFELCKDGNYEPGFEKIALYMDESKRFSHTARQLDDGKWTSKLAAEVDIEHDNLQVLTGSHLGSVWGFMKRPNRSSP